MTVTCSILVKILVKEVLPNPVKKLDRIKAIFYYPILVQQRSSGLVKKVRKAEILHKIIHHRIKVL